MATHLKSKGIDIFYIDEACADGLFILSSVQVPFLRFADDGVHYIWDAILRDSLDWRKRVSVNSDIGVRHELHGTKLLRLKGRLHKTGRALKDPEAVKVYQTALAELGFLPDDSIMTACAEIGSNLYGARKIEAAVIGLLQRARRKCENDGIHAMVFFDGGHDEYVKFFRRAARYLPTGSKYGAWKTGATKNMPLDMFLKDANIKNSQFSHFIQIADLVCHSALQKLRFEKGILPAPRIKLGHHLLYDGIAAKVVNLRATYKRKDGIVKV